MSYKLKIKNIAIFLITFAAVLIITSQHIFAHVPPNSTVVGDQHYRNVAGLQEVFKPKTNHLFSRFNLTDGEFYSVQANVMGNFDPIWRARNNSFWLYADLYAAVNGYQSGKFVYVSSDVDENDASLARQSFFKKGRIWIDVNGNGEDESEEFIDVTNGVISFSGSGSNLTFSFNLVLENGVKTIGTYSGKFLRV